MSLRMRLTTEKERMKGSKEIQEVKKYRNKGMEEKERKTFLLMRRRQKKKKNGTKRQGGLTVHAN